MGGYVEHMVFAPDGAALHATILTSAIAVIDPAVGAAIGSPMRFGRDRDTSTVVGPVAPTNGAGASSIVTTTPPREKPRQVDRRG